MKLLTFDQIQVALLERYREDLRDFPQAFDRHIPKPASETQLNEVCVAVFQLTGYDCPPNLSAIASKWDLTHLSIANFSFGYKGTFAERLINNNRSDAVNTWWEDAFEQRPQTMLFIAQSDPYVLLLNVQTDEVLANIADEGASTAKKIASDLVTCLRMLVTIQLYRPAEHGSLTVDEVKGVLGQDCDAQFWDEQIRHWAQFN